MPSKWRRYLKGGFWATLGFLLSPLSWWNDAFVNLPLALAFGWVVSLPYKPAFGLGVIVGYWLTNLLGFVMMHHGLRRIAASAQKPEVRRDFKRDLVISLLYTLVIVLLIKLKILQPLTDYF